MKGLSFKEGCFVFAIAVGLCVVSGCVGYAIKTSGKSAQTDEVVNEFIDNTEYDTTSDSYKEIESAFNKLKELSDTYVIANTLELPERSVCYIETIQNGGSYTEYPVDSNGTWGAISDDIVEYALYDFLTPEHESYMVSDMTGENEYSWIHMPKSYADDIASRNIMYLDRYISKLTDIQNTGNQVLNREIGEEYTVYTAKVPSYIVREVCSIDNIGLYNHVKDDLKDNESVVSLMDIYLSDIDKSMTFSDGLLTLGVSSDGVLSYVQLEAGGLGNVMYYTKQIVKDLGLTVREAPDFTNTVEYVNDIQDFADYVAKFDSYDDAMADLYDGNTVTGDLVGEPSVDSAIEDVETTITTEEVETIESTEVSETTEVDGTESEVEETTEVSTEN